MNELKKVYLDKLQQYIDERIYITDKSTEYDQEEERNYWWIGGTFDQVSSLSFREWRAFIERLIEDRQKQLDASPVKTDLIFYCYHDEQAGQLRFSVISSAHSKLPFGCKLKETDLETVLKEFLRDEFRGFIPMEFLQEVSPEEAEKLEAEEPEFILNVYVQKLRQAR